MLRFPYPYKQRHAALFLSGVKLLGVLRRSETRFAIETSGELAGGIGLLVGSGRSARRAELYYWLGEPFWGRGIATAAVRALTRYGFRTLQLAHVFALPFVDNRASCRVLEKAGFRRESIQRCSAVKSGVVHDQWVYALAHDTSVDHDGADGKVVGMNRQNDSRVIHLAEARAGIPGPAGEHSVSLLQRGSLNVKLSLPVRPNQQTPHAQDEVYVVIRGRGFLLHDGKRDRFESGDLLFVAAGIEHRFEDFTDDLAVWVVFFGPHGGEVPAESAV